MRRWWSVILPKRGEELLSSESFWVRLWTGLLAAALVLAALFESSGALLLLLAVIASTVAFREIMRLSCGPSLRDLPLFVGMLVVTWAISLPSSLPFALFLSGVAVVAWLARSSSPPRLAGLASWLLIGVGAGLWVHFALRPAAGSPASLLVLVLVPLWAGDTAAYLAGKIWGEIPLAPGISPGKTVEGAAANSLVCIGLTVAIWPFCVRQSEGDAILALSLGVVLAVTGQLGDLFQSRLKRLAGRKDSGTLLPGHGGLLDRIDSFLLASPPAAFFLSIFLADRFT